MRAETLSMAIKGERASISVPKDWSWLDRSCMADADLAKEHCMCNGISYAHTCDEEAWNVVNTHDTGTIKPNS